MKNKEFIIEQQKDFINNLKNKTTDFINKIDKSEIETILLSGSVSRADFFPRQKENGEYSALLRLFDGKSILMQLELSFPEYQMAKQMTEAWPEHAGEIYRHLIDTLGETKA